MMSSFRRLALDVALRRGRRVVPVLLSTALLARPGTEGRVCIVSSSGTAHGNGTLSRPLDFTTVSAAGGPVRACDRVSLRGGVYYGLFRAISTEQRVVALQSGPM